MRNCFLSVVFFASMSVSSQELSLSQGVGVTMENLATLAQTSLPLSVARTGQRSVGDPVVRAFYYSEDSGVVYSLSEGAKLYATRYSNRDLLGSWPLNNYPDLTIMSGELPQGAKVWHEEGIYKSPYWTVTDPSSPQTGKDIIHREGHIKPAKTHGCFDLQPLRYGDINQDGQAEIIVMKDGNISISSTTKRAEIFNANWFMNDDIVINNDPGTVIPEPTPEQLAAIPENAPQFGAYSNLLKYMEDQNLPAWRSFAKLYFGEFDGDSAHDILMWRKLYESRLMSDPVKGFYKKGELYIHYKLIDGVYKKQLTESSVIQGWLTAKNLTWQKGYPSKSECPGQTDQLIPEMHDPLLNDPDVLQ